MEKTRVRILKSPIWPGAPRFATLIQEAGKDDELEYWSGNNGKTRLVIGGSDTSWDWEPVREPGSTSSRQRTTLNEEEIQQRTAWVKEEIRQRLIIAGPC